MSATIEILNQWNQLSEQAAVVPILACCGSRTFANEMVDARPIATLKELCATADAIWWTLSKSDWLEAFACHPRIGEAAGGPSRQFSAWSSEEQSRTYTAEANLLRSIAEKNREYEERHGFIYIVCASGKSAEELLAILDRRLSNSTEIEINEAAEQQRQITQLRLRKWSAL